MKNITILLVEDDENLGFILKDFLELQSYTVIWQKDGEAGFQAFKSSYVDLCILDVMMPIKDGFTLAKEIREINEKVPIVFLSAKDMNEDKIQGFKIGADDYITKPFSTEELILRIEAILKRVQTDVEMPKLLENISIGKYTFDYSNQTLTIGEKKKHLTKKETEVLNLLCVNKNRLVKREFALKQIWGGDDYFMGRSMDVYITKLRKYIDDDPNVTIQNIHGSGFKIEVKE